MIKKFILLISLLLIATVFAIPQVAAEDTIEYPFDSITIVSAYSFQVIVAAAPSETSILFDQVAMLDGLTIYVGRLEMMLDGILMMESQIVIMTTTGGVDLARWIINTYMRSDDDHETFEFSSHITIDPLIGVVKDFTDPYRSVTVSRSFSDYSVTDNVGTVLLTVPGTFVELDGLDIVIAAYAGGA